VKDRRAELEALDLAVEQQKDFLKRVSLEEKDILARRRALFDEFDFFDNNSTAAAHTTQRFSVSSTSIKRSVFILIW